MGRGREPPPLPSRQFGTPRVLLLLLAICAADAVYMLSLYQVPPPRRSCPAHGWATWIPASGGRLVSVSFPCPSWPGPNLSRSARRRGGRAGPAAATTPLSRTQPPCPPPRGVGGGVAASPVASAVGFFRVASSESPLSPWAGRRNVGDGGAGVCVDLARLRDGDTELENTELWGGRRLRGSRPST